MSNDALWFTLRWTGSGYIVGVGLMCTDYFYLQTAGWCLLVAASVAFLARTK